MEDTVRIVDGYLGNRHNGFFGVYDGHGGRDVAAFLQQNLHEEIAKEIMISDDRSIEEKIESAYLLLDIQCYKSIKTSCGSTAVTAILMEDQDQEKTLHISNVGDSRAVICQCGLARNVTVEHIAESLEEASRISAHGGFSVNDRAFGILAVSRSFGDAELKEYIICKPQTTTLRLIPAADFPFLVIACDGLWNSLSDQEVVDIVKGVDDAMQENAARILVECVARRSGRDNTSAIVVFL